MSAWVGLPGGVLSAASSSTVQGIDLPVGYRYAPMQQLRWVGAEARVYLREKGEAVVPGRVAVLRGCSGVLHAGVGLLVLQDVHCGVPVELCLTVGGKARRVKFGFKG